jgi:hypothetical protein
MFIVSSSRWCDAPIDAAHHTLLQCNVKRPNGPETIIYKSL